MKLFYIILSIFLIPYAAFAENCTEATRLVTQAYDMGESPSVYSGQKELLHKALELCPNHPEAHNNLGSVLEMEKDYGQALFHYQRAVQAKPDFAEAWFGIGEVYYKTGKFALSLEAYLKACKTDKDARNRIRELLNSQRYKVSEAGEITDKESLLALFDRNRRENINRMISECNFKADVQPVFVFRNILFDTGSAALKSECLAQLKEIGSALSEVGDAAVIISGHTDRQPFAGKSQAESDSLNMRLSKDRAESVARELIKMGISSSRIQTKDYGSTMPEENKDTPDAYVKNRRVTIEVN